jgi:hypothetical protein
MRMRGGTARDLVSWGGISDRTGLDFHTRYSNVNLTAYRLYSNCALKLLTKRKMVSADDRLIARENIITPNGTHKSYSKYPMNANTPTGLRFI